MPLKHMRIDAAVCHPLAGAQFSDIRLTTTQKVTSAGGCPTIDKPNKPLVGKNTFVDHNLAL